jgi:hypothetical protein
LNGEGLRMGLEVAKRGVRGWFGVVGTRRGGIQEGGGLARKRPEGGLGSAPNAQTGREG